MNELLFRQAIFHPITGEFLRWHYWGLIDKTFVGIDTGWVNPTKAVEDSQQFTGLTDKKKTRIYEGDIVIYGSVPLEGVVTFGEFSIDDKHGNGEQKVIGWYVKATKDEELHEHYKVISNIYEYSERRKDED